MQSLDKLLGDEATASNIAKRERLIKGREKDKLERLLGGVADLTRLPAALFIVDVKREHIAVAEAKRLGIPVIAMCDTNSNPNEVDFVIPANDDAYKSISLITLAIGKAIEEGLIERKQERDDARLAEEEDVKRSEDLGQEVAEAPKAVIEAAEEQ